MCPEPTLKESFCEHNDSFCLLLSIRLLLEVVLHTTLQRLADIMLILVLLLSLAIAGQARHSATSSTFDPGISPLVFL